MSNTCPTCGHPFTPSYRRRKDPPQRWCSFTCWNASRRARYDEMLALIEMGETPRRAAERTGISVVAAERWFRRNGPLELARLFGRARKSGAYV